MKETLEAILDMFAIVLVRQKLIIDALERQNVLTRAEVDKAYEEFPQNEMDEATAKVRKLFLEHLQMRSGSK